MRLLLLSSSRVAGRGFLDAYERSMREFLGDGCCAGAFLPYASVAVPWAEYSRSTAARLAAMGYRLTGADPASADAIVVGGGNTFQLLRELHARGLLDAIRARVAAGVPYVGWSAGANVACPSIRTTNDMPIVFPPSFDALGLVPFQINPHYTDAQPPGHMGETREQRLEEFLAVAPQTTVVGLREGSALRVEGAQVTLLGPHPVRLFRAGSAPRELPPGDVSAALAA